MARGATRPLRASPSILAVGTGQAEQDSTAMASSTPPRASRRVISYLDARRAAMRRFAETSSIDMEALAGDLAVSRATLYRVVPGRDELLGDVVWRYAQRMFETARREAAGEGEALVRDTLRRFGRQIMDSAQFRRFIRSDPDTATRVLFTPAGRVHERFVEAILGVVAPQVRSGALSSPFDVDGLAYVLARIYESFWYADLLSGREPDLDDADAAAAAILRAGQQPADS